MAQLRAFGWSSQNMFVAVHRACSEPCLRLKSPRRSDQGYQGVRTTDPTSEPRQVCKAYRAKKSHLYLMFWNKFGIQQISFQLAIPPCTAQVTQPTSTSLHLVYPDLSAATVRITMFAENPALSQKNASVAALLKPQLIPLDYDRPL